MAFTSFQFLLFFPVISIVGYLIPRRYRWMYLLAASYYFYINWQPVYALLLAATTTVTYLCGRWIERSADAPRKRKAALTVGCLAPLGVLFFFKYYNFINAAVFAGLEMLGIRWPLPEMKLLMPVGISFYTFMAIGYVADVYKGHIGAERNPALYALFIAFFPQVISGPVGRAGALLPQLKNPEALSHDNVMEGVKMMLWGYFMKLCVADRLGIYVDTVYANADQHSGVSLLTAALLYSVQIYGDFGGYSLMAIGAARTLGIRLTENFRRPYLSHNIREFWSRWHIALSTWFRDYVYIPLGGNRVSMPRHLANLMITFLVSGLWHGANWTFILWGAIHGGFLIVETLWRTYKPAGWSFPTPVLLKIAACFACVNFAWIFFRAPDIRTAGQIIAKIFTEHGGLFVDKTLFAMGLPALAILMVKDLHDEYGWGTDLLRSRNFFVSHLSVIALAVFVLLFGVLDGGQFIYFQF